MFSPFRLVPIGLLVAAANLAAQQRIYVRDGAPPSGNGTSWATAYADLQLALAHAGSLEIWVARGRYRPSPIGDRAARFTLRSGVAIYGGFAGTESERFERDPRAQVTILTGDLAGDDAVGSGRGWYLGAQGYGDNSYRVVQADQADATARLDGFVIEAGYAFDTTGGITNASGLLLDACSMTVHDCTFRHCFSYWAGGAISVVGGNPTLSSCRVLENMTTDGVGGGLSIHAGTATVRDGEFAANTSRGYVNGNGGALYVDFDASATVQGCRFVDNESRTFAGGRSPASGGGVFVGGDGTSFDRCTFVGNVANGGGGVFSYRGLTVTNSLFDGNQVVGYAGLMGYGGGLAVVAASGTIPVTVRGCTFVHGAASDDGGGMFALNTTGTVTGCVFWGNRDGNGQIGRSQCRGMNPRYSCVQNLLIGPPNEDPPDPRNFPGSIDTPPGFVDADGADNLAGNLDDDVRLLATSPCIDAADTTAVAGTDRAGMPRRLDGNLDGALRADMGAHEYGLATLSAMIARSPGQAAVTLAVDGSASTLGVLCLGAPGTGLPVASFGELFLDLAQPVVFVPLGTLPAQLQATTAVSGAVVRVQALGLAAGLRGTFSNAATLEL